MHSVMPEEDGANRRIAAPREKTANGALAKDDESRSFLDFSRENLGISHSDLEQGFNRPRFRPRRSTVLSCAAILVALLCLALEIWKLRCVLENARDIDALKRDVKTLERRLLDEDLLDELKAFEEQLYAEEGTGEEEEEDDDDDDDDDDNPDYDSQYDEEDEEYNEPSSSHDSSGDYYASSSFSSDYDPETVERPNVTAWDVEEARGAAKSRESDAANLEEERLVDEMDDRASPRSKSKRSIPPEDPVGFSDSGVPIYSSAYVRSERNRSGTNVSAGLNLYDTLKSGQREWTSERDGRVPVMHRNVFASRERHSPPKKYYAQRRPATAHVSPSDVASGGSARRSDRRNGTPRATLDGSVDRPQNTDASARAPRRGAFARRHLRAPRQVFAVHYGADSSLFSERDEHNGNGKGRHHEGIYRAWRASSWVDDLGMTSHFSLGTDGRLTVHEPGLYLIYAQIHYLDEHDENGFHVLVNGAPIMQCLIYSPGFGNKSRSCFSAQATFLRAGDHLLMKDIAAARYTLFQKDKSFFGLVKLGDWRQQQQQQQQQRQQPVGGR